MSGADRSDSIRTLADCCAGLTVRFPAELPPHAAQLMRTLGIRVTVDPNAPGFCCTNPNQQRRQRRTDPRRTLAPTCDSSGRGEGAPPPSKETRSSEPC